MTERLPLFPLGTVLFPGLVLPLHVFEERYRELVRDLVDLPEGAPRRFGVVAIREGREVGADGVRALYDVGCTAELHRVEAYEDGRFDIVTAGVTRFRLRGLDSSRPYTQGEVDFLAEVSGPAAPLLAGAVGRAFRRYRDALLSARREPTPARASTSRSLPDEPVVLSYLVAAAMTLDLPDKQALLAAATVADRLTLELALLRREVALLRVLPSLPAVDLVRAPYGLS